MESSQSYGPNGATKSAPLAMARRSTRPRGPSSAVNDRSHPRYETIFGGLPFSAASAKVRVQSRAASVAALGWDRACRRRHGDGWRVRDEGKGSAAEELSLQARQERLQRSDVVGTPSSGRGERRQSRRSPFAHGKGGGCGRDARARRKRGAFE